MGYLVRAHALLLVASFFTVFALSQAADLPESVHSRRALTSLRDSKLDEEKCNVEYGVDWVSGDKFQRPLITKTPGECCEECMNTPDCKVWLWRGCCNHCWIKDRITERAPCDGGDCVGGFKEVVNGTRPPDADIGGEELGKDKGTDLPTNPKQIQAFLNNCRKSGELGGFAAAFAACSKLLNKCPVPTTDAGARIAEAEPAAASADIEVLEDQLEESCRVVTRESCKSSARSQVELFNSDCDLVLRLGPDVKVKGCEDIVEASIIFENQVQKTCDAN